MCIILYFFITTESNFMSIIPQYRHLPYFCMLV
uniref:Uncharacterized protein n=1 Tax=Ciona intestinalis TaxID=7719 RepID=H2XLM1_CIOIN